MWRTAKNFADALRHLTVELYLEAEQLVFVIDNLNTRSTACLYDAFVPKRARAISARLEWDYTPKNGSLLNIAEVEFAALTTQCPDHRIGSFVALWKHVEVRGGPERAYGADELAVHDC